MRRLLVTLVVIAAAGLALVIPAAGSAGTTSPTVKIADTAFEPRALTVRHGTTVQWKWVGFLQHNIVVLKAPAGAKKFKSKTQVHGGYSHLFTVKGKFTLLCTIHGFTMTVNVT